MGFGHIGKGHSSEKIDVEGTGVGKSGKPLSYGIPYAYLVLNFVDVGESEKKHPMLEKVRRICPMLEFDVLPR